jgi:hypothetical protein
MTPGTGTSTPSSENTGSRKISREAAKADPKPLGARWARYVAERSPPAALVFIGAGISMAPMALRNEFDPVLLGIGVLATFLLLAQMRLGDEIKDLRKDREIHPERPLPRGLLSLREVTQGMLVIMLLVVLLAVLGARHYGSLFGGRALLFTTAYIWLMWKEFFVGQKLSKEPMTYAFTHQLVVFPLYGWTGAMYGSDFALGTEYLGYLTYCFGASFFFEIARKLDPDAHPLMGTYLHHYGPRQTALFLAFCSMISLMGAVFSGDEMWVGPIQLLVLASVFLVPAKPEKFKVVEGIAMLNATVLMWVPTLRWGARALTGN